MIFGRSGGRNCRNGAVRSTWHSPGTAVRRSGRLGRLCGDFGFGEFGLDLVGQRAVMVDEPTRDVPRSLEQPPVCAEARELQVRQSRLSRPEQLALPAQLEVFLRQLEAVR